MMQLLYAILFCLVAHSAAQDIEQEEMRFDHLQSEMIQIRAEIDSLNAQLNSILIRVDREKAMAGKDEKKITGLMAEGLSLSGQIEQKQKMYNNNREELSILKRALSDFYTNAIETEREKLGDTTTEEEKAAIEQNLFILTGKRLIVSPVIPDLKFNPEKIKQMDIKNTDDVFEKSILKNYIENAIANLDSNINLLSAKESELQESRKLQSKADLFVDDVANSRIVGVFENESFSQAAETDETRDGNGGFYEQNYKAIAENQNYDYSLLHHQMQELGFNFDDKVDFSNRMDDTPVSEEEYLNIIRTGKEFLKQYRDRLITKLAENGH